MYAIVIASRKILKLLITLRSYFERVVSPLLVASCTCKLNNAAGEFVSPSSGVRYYPL